MVIYQMSNCFEGADTPRVVCYGDIMSFIYANYKTLLEEAKGYGEYCCFHFYLVEDCEITEEMHFNKEQLLKLVEEEEDEF